MKYNRLLPLITPALIFILCQLYFFYPSFIYLTALISTILIITTLSQFCRTGNLDKKWHFYILLPLLFTISILAFSTIISRPIIIQLLFFANVIFMYIYLRATYYYLFYPPAYVPNTIENVSSYSSILIVFWLSAAIFSFQSILNISIWFSAFITLAYTFAIVSQNMWAYKLEFKNENLVYLIIICLILIEIFWAVSFLSFIYLVQASLFAISYYLLIGITRLWAINKLNSKILKLYISTGIILFFLVILTAQWI